MTPVLDPTLQAVYALPGRATRAIIDLDALAANVAAMRRVIAEPTALMAVVKADGYGHGAVMVARCALASGATMLGVATVGEAADLRAHQISAPILLLGPCDASEIERALLMDIELTIAGPDVLDVVDRIADRLDKTARIHLKIDSGMHRYGAAPREALAMVDQLEAFERIDLVGISTHFAAADLSEHSANNQQSAVFEQAVAQIQVRMGRAVPTHCANSAASLRGMAAGSGMARCGIALYGLAPGPEIALPDEARPVLSITSKLARVHRGDAGSGVGYGHTYICERSERLGLLPIGYADGYPRLLSNRAWIKIGGVRCPIRGRVSMDQTVVGDVPDHVNVGEVAGIAGPLGKGPGFDDLAGMTGTISYEVVAGLSRRIPRYYIAGDRVVATLIDGVLETR